MSIVSSSRFMCGDRPRRRFTMKCDELPPPHSINSTIPHRDIR